MTGQAKVAVLMGSTSDEDKMAAARDTLEKFGIEVDWRVMSAHRNPAKVAALASTARENGYVADGLRRRDGRAPCRCRRRPHHSPCRRRCPSPGGALDGIDSLYATVQMPKGVPVATVAVNGSMNAALLVVQMLGIRDEEMAAKLADHKREMAGG